MVQCTWGDPPSFQHLRPLLSHWSLWYLRRGNLLQRFQCNYRSIPHHHWACQIKTRCLLWGAVPLWRGTYRTNRSTKGMLAPTHSTTQRCAWNPRLYLPGSRGWRSWATGGLLLERIAQSIGSTSDHGIAHRHSELHQADGSAHWQSYPSFLWALPAFSQIRSIGEIGWLESSKNHQSQWKNRSFTSSYTLQRSWDLREQILRIWSRCLLSGSGSELHSLWLSSIPNSRRSDGSRAPHRSGLKLWHSRCASQSCEEAAQQRAGEAYHNWRSLESDFFTLIWLIK